MKTQKKTIIPAIGVLLVLFTLNACSGNGKLDVMPRSEQDQLLADLVARSGEYFVYSHGYGDGHMSGILFDPREDGRKIVPEGFLWKRIDDPAAMAAVIDRINSSNHPGYIQRLYEINNESGEFYGYLYTGWSYLAIKTVDESSVRVFGLQDPPEYADVYPGGT